MREPGLATFVVLDLEPGLSAAMSALSWEPSGAGWRKTFAGAEPKQVESAFTNLPRLLEAALQMAGHARAVDWQPALEYVSDLLNAHGVDWWLTGSAAIAVRGAALAPRDLDLVVADSDAQRVGELLLDALIEPVNRSSWDISDWFGRAVLTARVEWVGGVTAAADAPYPTDFGPAAAAALHSVPRSAVAPKQE